MKQWKRLLLAALAFIVLAAVCLVEARMLSLTQRLRPVEMPLRTGWERRGVRFDFRVPELRKYFALIEGDRVTAGNGRARSTDVEKACFTSLAIVWSVRGRSQDHHSGYSWVGNGTTRSVVGWETNAETFAAVLVSLELAPEGRYEFVIDTVPGEPEPCVRNARFVIEVNPLQRMGQLGTALLLRGVAVGCCVASAVFLLLSLAKARQRLT